MISMNGKFETNAIHKGEKPNFNASGDVVVPIHLSSTFARASVDKPPAGYEYSRSANPTRDALEKKLASLEKAKYGLAFSSGLGAETTLLLSLLKSGDHVIAFDDLYGGTKRLFNEIFAKRFGITFTYVDATDPIIVEKAINSKTKLIWLETPTNPLLKIGDINAISRIAKNRGILTAVDNTFMSPYSQNPLLLGADIVLHSTTKYINGHSDSIGGAIMTNELHIFEKLKFTQNAAGNILSPFDSYLVARGIKTLAPRMKAHNSNALAIANFLQNHPLVDSVQYPGLPSHPQHELAKKQMTGFGGVISFELKGTTDTTKKFLANLKLFLLAESLGGVESLIEHPATMTHASLTVDERKSIGITDTLIRVSVGIEHADDLIADLQNALEKI